MSSMAYDTGKIIGPLISDMLMSLIGFENAGTLTAFAFAAYGIVYLFGSGLFSKWIFKHKTVTPAPASKCYPEVETEGLK